LVCADASRLPLLMLWSGSVEGPCPSLARACSTTAAPPSSVLPGCCCPRGPSKAAAAWRLSAPARACADAPPCPPGPDRVLSPRVPTHAEAQRAMRMATGLQGVSQGSGQYRACAFAGAQGK